jgi:hypothetical protein
MVCCHVLWLWLCCTLLCYAMLCSNGWDMLCCFALCCLVGNYRDVNQNRRSNLLFEPRIGPNDALLFWSLMQADAYNPLQIRSQYFEMPSEGAGLCLFLTSVHFNSVCLFVCLFVCLNVLSIDRSMSLLSFCCVCLACVWCVVVCDQPLLWRVV